MELNTILIRLGVDPNSIRPKTRFARDDAPPSSTKLITSRFLSPRKRDSEHDKDEFNYDTTQSKSKFIFRSEELNKWRLDRIDKLLLLYEEQLKMLPTLINANKVANNNSKTIDQRRHYYYCYLTSLITAPTVISLTRFQDLITINKLWRNRTFQENKDPLKVPLQCCACEGCFFIALHGSKYCYWHILNDEKQQLFEKCSRCGHPVMICGNGVCHMHKVSSKL